MSRNYKDYRVRVLCEDKTHRDFVRGFLGFQGFDERKIELALELPDGQGSGKQFVCEHLAEAVSRYIGKRRGEKVLLVAVQDVDLAKQTAQEAKSKLSQILEDADLQEFENSGQLLMLFSKRNIETWFEWLLQEPSERKEVSEEADFKPKHKNAKPKTIGKQAGELYAASKNDESVCSNAPPSLVFACEEFTSLCNKL